MRSLLFVPFFVLPLLAARPSFTADDLWNWRTASDPRISPDGQWVVYVESWNDRNANRQFANLWIASTDGKTRRPFTQGAWRDRMPRWSPDGTRIGWLSDRGGAPQIFQRAFASGTDTADTQVTRLDPQPLTLAWSPDGKSFAFTRLAALAPPAPWAPPAILPRLAHATYRQLSVTSATAPLSTAGFSVVGEPAWMIDGQSILAACEDGRIYRFGIAGGAPQPVAAAPGHNRHPVVSPDGSRIAWLSTRDNTQSYATRKLYVMNADGSRQRILAGSLDRDVTDPQWSSDSRNVYFLADDRGSTYAWAAHNDGTVRQVTTVPQRLRGFSLADNGRAVTVRSTASEAGGVFTFTVDRASQPVTLADPNGRLLAEREIAPVEVLPLAVAGRSAEARPRDPEEPARAWITRPPAFDAAKKYPLLLEIHDDPRTMCGPDFCLYSQIVAARGFVVLCVNPRGTPGYGEVWGNLLPTSFPGDDYDDLMRAVDTALATGSIDSQHLTLTGGLLAAWTIGHTTRFHAAVARRPIVDWAIHVALAPDGLRQAEAWLGAFPWDDPSRYTASSPLFHAQHFRTPTLVLAADPDPEADALYFALKARHIETALIRLPRTPTPADTILEMETVLTWLARP